MSVLEVAAGERKVLLPLEAVYHTLCAPASQLSDSGDTAMLTLADRAIPFRTLGGILGQRKSSTSSARSWVTVVLKVGESFAAVGVDSLGGIRSAIVRPLQAQCGSLPLVAGATLDGAGNPKLVLDPAGLAAAVRRGEGERAGSAVRPPPPVLVVDDSLTTRMLEQNVLEAAGYQVDVATSGEEAIEVARKKDYALFVVDVEMPGMNGFELIERFRGDPLTHAIPAILVTSRSSAEDRNRGERAGASAFMVKSEFDEKRLLRTIRDLITVTAP
jgi:two-component system chemotaxis sensor kinase CheA